jgi:hypothetical protein
MINDHWRRPHADVDFRRIDSYLGIGSAPSGNGLFDRRGFLSAAG